MHRDRAQAIGPLGLDTAPRRELDLFRGVLARGDARPERVELYARIRRPYEANERGEVSETVGLRVHLHRRVAPTCDKKGRGYAGVRARIALRVDTLQS